MYKDCEWGHKIFSVDNDGFEALALEIFRFQYAENPVYNDWCKALQINPGDVRAIAKIPFLPVSFFKTHIVQSGLAEKPVLFESSGTTKTVTGRHWVNDISLYEKSFTAAFEKFYGRIKDYCVIGLLPAYLERANSSLVYMVDKLVRQSGHEKSGFYLNEYEKLYNTLLHLEDKKQKTLLIGVTFALLDFADAYNLPLRYTIMMETGGMKGRRKEMIRDEVHEHLKKSFSLSSIHSEYGMTELLSQAYSKGDGIFNCPPWMKVLAREEDDPLHLQSEPGNNAIKRGALNVIDLANVYSCSFIATDDAGKVFPDGSFEVQGRMDNSDIRGCNLLIL